jgi:DNA-binding protein
MADDKNKPDQSQGEIVIYQAEDGLTKVECRFVDETVWLTQQQMAELFHTSRSNIVEHIGHIYEEGELDEVSTCRKFRQVRMEGNRQVTRELPFYNLDMIISLGYRVKSLIATQFRRWATERLKEYMIKGFTMDDERLKNLGGGNYWRELLERIRDIRSSEKVMYRQVLDLYATSVDYNPRSAESVAFFKMVQNKLHYAAHGHTAAEVIYERADADKPFMGLTAFSGDFPTAKDIGIAKNYLSEEELRVLNQMVSGYFDFAEVQAIRHRPMYMSDYVEQLDNILRATGEEVLTHAGKISHAQAMEKAKAEYKRYQAQTLSPVEEEYLKTIKQLGKTAKTEAEKQDDSSEPS